MTAQLAPIPVAKFFSNDGFPLSFGQLFTYAAGTTTPQATYVDSTQTTQNTNPIQLNFRGECNLWLDPTKTYKFLLEDLLGNVIPGWPIDNISIGNANPSFNVIPTVDNLYTLGSTSFSWANVFVGVNHAPVLDTVSGNIGYYARTASEIAAGVTPTNYVYVPGIVDRYGTNTTPGTTDMTQAIKNAYAVIKQSNGTLPLNFLGTTYLVTDTCIAVTTADAKITIQGVPLRTVIVNKAAAAKPTITLTDAQIWDIRGLVFTGAATFPNVGLSIQTSGGQRCAFGYLRDIVCCTNGGGVHLVGCNTITLENYQYWPSGQNWGGTIDTNGQPYGILADGTTAVNGITLRNINIGGLNTIANGGCGVKIDGSSSGAAFQAWEIDELECEISGTRSLWVRNVNIGSFKNLFVENTEIRYDQNCVRVRTEGLEGAAVATIVVDGTQSLGLCFQLAWDTCQASSFTADASNVNLSHYNCTYSGAGYNDSSVNPARVNVRGAASAVLPDSFGFGGQCGGISATAANITNGATISTNIVVARVTTSTTPTGVIMASGSFSGQQCTVINEGTTAITMAASGTSHVADGTSCVIGATVAMPFTWNGSLWYHR